MSAKEDLMAKLKGQGGEEGKFVAALLETEPDAPLKEFWIKVGKMNGDRADYLHAIVSFYTSVIVSGMIIKGNPLATTVGLSLIREGMIDAFDSMSVNAIKESVKK